MIERIEKTIIEPVFICNQTTLSDIQTNLKTMSIRISQDLSLSHDYLITCCDYFDNGELNYQFTMCDKNVGIYILTDRLGSKLDF